MARDIKGRAIAQEILRRLGLEGRNVPSELEEFIDRHAGRDRQLTLRLAYYLALKQRARDIASPSSECRIFGGT